MEMVREIFKKMNEEYTGVMRRFNSRGALSMWDRSRPSVWLTGWTLQIFRDVAFQVQLSLLLKLLTHSSGLGGLHLH